MMSVLKYIFNEYVVRPLYLDTGYNVINTLLYAVGFVVGVWLVYSYFFMKGRIDLNERFAISLSGWMVAGGVLRVMKDAGIVNSLLFVTPFIYILLFFCVVSIIYLEKLMKVKAHNLLLYLGWGVSLIGIYLMPIQNLRTILIVLMMWIPVCAMFYISREFVPLLRDKWGLAALQAQMLDAFGSFSGITLCGFWEKHVLARSVIKAAESVGLKFMGSGAWVLIPLKLVVVTAVLHLLNKYVEDKTLNRFAKLVVIILGVGIGVRNTLAAGVFC